MQVAEKHQGGRIGPKRWLGVLAAPALLLVVIVGFYWRLVLSDQYNWLESPDIANQVLPWFQFQAGEWRQGRFPMWDPHHGTGQPLIGQGQPGAAYPPNWILFSLPLNNGWIRQVYLHWYFVLTRFLAAWFCYWLCRDLGRSRRASMLGGVVFSLGGYVGFTDWPQMVNGAIWAPLVFLFAIRAWRGRDPAPSAALAGMFLGVSWLSGHHQIPIFLSLVLTGLWAHQALRGGRVRWTVVRAAAFFFTFAGLTSALQALPAWEYGQRALRWVSLPNPVSWKDPIPYTVHTNFSLDPIDILGLALPGVCPHAELLVGALALALSMAAVALGFRSPAVRLLAVTGAAGLALALGGSSVVHGVLYAVVPLVEKARVPLAAIVILHFSVACLSAWALDRLCFRSQRHGGRRVALALAAAGSVSWVLAGALWVAKDRVHADGVAFPALVLMIAGAVLWARQRGWISAGVAAGTCLVLVMLELGSVRGPLFPHRRDTERSCYLNKMAQSADAIGFIKQHRWPVRADVDERKMPFNVGDWHGIDVLSSNVPSLLENFVRLGPEGERTHLLLGVHYHLGTAPRWAGQVLAFRGADGVNVYQNPGAFPRVWPVHELVRLDQAGQVGPTLSDRGFDLAKKGFVVGEVPPELEPAVGRDTVRLVLREPHRVRIEAEMGSKGMVVLSDAFYPGWKATVDGRRVAIYEVYGGLRGVVTPAGRHVIEMVYRPVSVFLGGALTALGVFGACGLAVASRRRRRGKT
jgi:hypothetical protein